MTAERVRNEREAREAHARQIAATIEPGDYFASGDNVVEHGTYRTVATCDSHWDAILVMLAIPKK